MKIVLCAQFPAFYMVSSLHGQPIAGFILDFNHQCSGFVSWDFQLLRNLTDKGIEGGF